jgi:putative peptide zinc metalloprotease protein
MTAVAEPPPPAAGVEEQTTAPLNRGEGVELLGPVHGSGYKEGAALVRRGDGQMVHLGPLMYALLEETDGRRDHAELAVAMSQRLGRGLEAEHVGRLAEKLADQGLLAGTEHKAPPRRNPLLALRWKVLVTNPAITRRLTAPFTVLFRPWLMWPVLAGFLVVCWFVLFHKGVASATAQAFNSPGLLLLVFALAVASAGFHELGHASACRYGGADPAGMGVGIYLVWPAFYTDVTDAYRLPKRSRLRVDLGGLYFNAVVADLTLLVWLVWRVDALLLLVALQLLQMVKQLSPVIRADGYHILSDATGIPDLFSHMGPTLRRLLPGHRREPSALTGRARVLVTSWVLIIVPVLLSLAVSAVLLLPKLATNAWDSGSHIASAIPDQLGGGDILGLLASLLRLFALFMPVIGSALVTQKVVRMTVSGARSWSDGSAKRRIAAIAAGAAVIAALAWAWWPAGQYQPVRATDRGTLVSMGQLVSSPTAAVRPAPAQPAAIQLTPGRHLAVSMIPVGGATRQHPAMFVISQGKGKPAVAIVSPSAPDPSHASGGTFSPKPGSGTPSTAVPSTPPSASTPAAPAASPVSATAFPFQLPSAPGPGGTQALAANTKDGGVLYDVAYSIVTVQDGSPVTNTNSAYAIAHCKACTTVAVSFQVVLVIGQSRIIAPINAAGALNYDCTACLTTAIADQIVVTLSSQPSKELAAQLAADLKQLNALPQLGANATPAAVASAVAAVQQEIETQLHNSGLMTTSSSPGSSSGSSSTSSSSSDGTSTTTTSSSPPATTSTPSGSTTTTPTPSSTTPTTTTPTPTSTTTTSTSTTPTTTTTTTTPSDSGTTATTSSSG